MIETKWHALAGKKRAPQGEGGLGFRDLKTFNLALLAKQGWQLQKNSQSLVYRVMKARYFPSTDFLHAELGSKHSHAWRGIFSALPVVQAGCWWQVGNGTSICIWTDRWLPRPSTFQVISPPASLPLDSKISSLINPDSGDWDVTLITQTFLPDDVNSILGIPLSRHKPRDRLVWAYTPKGSFTVNSAYILPRPPTAQARAASGE